MHDFGLSERNKDRYRHSKPITARQLAILLRPSDVVPRTIRVTERQDPKRGLCKDQAHFFVSF
jgi:hypothetical protein